MKNSSEITKGEIFIAFRFLGLSLFCIKISLDLYHSYFFLFQLFVSFKLYCFCLFASSFEEWWLCLFTVYLLANLDLILPFDVMYFGIWISLNLCLHYSSLIICSIWLLLMSIETCNDSFFEFLKKLPMGSFLFLKFFHRWELQWICLLFLLLYCRRNQYCSTLGYCEWM